MFTTFDKAIAAMIAPVMSLLVLTKLIPQEWATPEFVAGATSFVTTIVVWLVPNKTV